MAHLVCTHLHLYATYVRPPITVGDSSPDVP